MREIVYSNKFVKDLKRLLKRGLDESILLEVINMLSNDEKLPERCSPHKLSGAYAGLWECHIKPDVLLIYEYSFDNKELFVRRTGSHSDLF